MLSFDRSTVSNTIKETMCYCDYPMPADFPNYMHHSKYLEYLRMYVDHFQLEQYIRFETEVVSVEQQQDGKGSWSVATRKTKDSSDTTTEIFDAVMVCVGISSIGNMPTFDGQEQFNGELIHSLSYRLTSLLNLCSIYRVQLPPSATKISLFSE